MCPPLPYPLPLSDFIIAPSAPELPSELVPETIVETCPNCEEGGVLVGQGEAWEHYEDCKVCLGIGSTTLHRCEICSRLVSEHELDAANVCVTCFEKGLRLVEDDDDYDRWAKEQVQFGISVGWL